MKRYLYMWLCVAFSLTTFLACDKEDESITHLAISPLETDTLYTGRNYQLKVETSPEVNDPRLSWSVSDASVATIQYGGVLTPISSGKVTVYVNSLQSGGERIRASRSFVVIGSGIYLDDDEITINPLKEYQLKYKLLPEGYQPSEAITWVSSDASVASVDDQGRVRGLQDGTAVIKVRLGNPLSRTYSEDSCTVKVQNFVDPTYTYRDGVLVFEQTVPGLLPMVAKDMPYFQSITLKGPINGTDLLFLGEQATKIQKLDLSGTNVISGGRQLEFRDPVTEVKSMVSTGEGTIPQAMLRLLTIPVLQLPPALTSVFDFDEKHVYTELIFPSGYTDIQISRIAAAKLVLPNGLKSLKINEGLKTAVYNYGSALPTAVISGDLSLPEGLQDLVLLGQVDGKLSLPQSLQGLTLGGKFAQVYFPRTSSMTTLPSTFSPTYIYEQANDKENFIPTHSFESITLPEGMEAIADKAFSNQIVNVFLRSSRVNANYTISEINFPRSLRRIGTSAFFACHFGQTLKLNEGLERIGLQAFFMAHFAKLYLPNSLKAIEDQAFALNPDLEDVYITAQTPPTLGKAAFLRTTTMDRIHRLHIPRGTRSAYISAGYSDYFFEVVED